MYYVIKFYIGNLSTGPENVAVAGGVEGADGLHDDEANGALPRHEAAESLPRGRARPHAEGSRLLEPGPEMLLEERSGRPAGREADLPLP